MQRTHVFLASVVLLAVAVCTQAADADLLGWWKLDDGTGTIAIDSSGNGHDGTFVGDPEWVTARAVSACHLGVSMFPREP